MVISGKLYGSLSRGLLGQKLKLALGLHTPVRVLGLGFRVTLDAKV